MPNVETCGLGRFYIVIASLIKELLFRTLDKNMAKFVSWCATVFWVVNFLLNDIGSNFEAVKVSWRKVEIKYGLWTSVRVFFCTRNFKIRNISLIEEILYSPTFVHNFIILRNCKMHNTSGCYFCYIFPLPFVFLVSVNKDLHTNEEYKMEALQWPKFM
jgi:hypothetical protein